jgi:hypothetical protein
MKAQGRTHAEYGFKKPNDGWHIVEMGEGIDLMKDGEGNMIKDAKGNNLWKFPAKINEDTAEDHGVDIGQVVPQTDFGEQKIADILAGIGEFANFEKGFPGERSFFEQPIMDKIKIKVPGKFLKIRTETSKDGKYSNTVEMSDMKFVPEEKVAGKAGKAAGKKKEEPTAATASATSEW